MLRKRLVLLLIVALCATGCGNASITSEVTTRGTVSLAISQAAEKPAVRVTQWVEQTIDIPVLEFNLTTTMDENAPLAVAEVDAQRSHFVMDFGQVLAGITEEPLNIRLEMWLAADRLVVDTTQMQTLVGAVPDVATGAFAPGVAYVDLTELSLGGEDVVEALTGSVFPDLRELASLPEALLDIEQTSIAPPTYRGTITYSELIAAMGQDVDSVMNSFSAGLGLANILGDNPIFDELKEIYEVLPAEVTIILDDDGKSLRELHTKIDLSSLYAQLLEIMLGAYLPDFSTLSSKDMETELADMNAALEELWEESPVHIIQTRTLFETPDGLVVPQAPQTDDNRTELWKDLLSGSGLFIS